MLENSSINCRFDMRVDVVWEPCDFVRSVHSAGLLLSRSTTGRFAWRQCHCRSQMSLHWHKQYHRTIIRLEMRDTDLFLKKSHSYYDQVQGQLFKTKRSTCIFIVYTKVDLRTIHVDLDIEYCETSLIPKQKLFYDKFFLEYITQFAL